MSMYLVSRAPAGAAGPRGLSESRLSQILRLSHCIAITNDTLATAVTAVNHYSIITVFYCYLLQQCSTVTPPTKHVSMDLLFLSWFFLPSMASVPCLRGTYRTYGGSGHCTSREWPAAGLGYEVM